MADKLVSDWLRSQFSSFLDVYGFLRDRRQIIRNPLSIIRDPTSIKSPPLAFAVKGIMLPGILVATIISVIGFFIPLPEREISPTFATWNSQQEVLKSFRDLTPTDLHAQPGLQYMRVDESISEESLDELFDRKEVNERDLATTPKTSGADNTSWRNDSYSFYRSQEIQLVNELINRANGRESDEARRMDSVYKGDRLKSESLARIEAGLLKFREPLVGLSLILNAYIFGWLIKRLKPLPPNVSMTTSVHLYSLGSSLFYPSVVAAILSASADLGQRPGIVFLGAGTELFLMFLVSLWSVFSLLLAGRRMGILLDGKSSLLGRVTWRLVASQILVILLTQVPLDLYLHATPLS